MADTQARTQCCVVGAGPAGVFLALLLAQRGVEVVVLEAHGDFDRDFRGDTVHPATLELLAEMGLVEQVLALPHGRIDRMRLHAGARSWQVANFSRLRTAYPYVAIIPQSEFLACLAEAADLLPTFSRRMGAGVVDVIEDDGRVSGVRYREAGELHELRADLVVGTDGRFSRLRRILGAEVDAAAPPMDVAWARIPRGEEDAPGFHVGAGRLLVHFRRPDAIQLGYVFPRDGFAPLKTAGIAAFRASIAEMVPAWAERLEAIESFADVHLLRVQSDCLRRWYRDGLLLLGDAAHAFSPVGGVGINYAIGDAAEAVELLLPAFRDGGPVATSVLARVEARRRPLVRWVQRAQTQAQSMLVERALDDARAFVPPWPMRALLAVPGLRDLPARMMAFGPRKVRLPAL
ncbi:MAG: FAD-dependent oxidoreductase [Pseudomonadota bacterium]|nr:FAD-dependent oxidoreductase [Pseudomonadota bacterium]